MSSTFILALAAAFNLICTGANTNGKMLDMSKKPSQVQTVLRVDLDNKRWCSGDCGSTAAIEEVTDTHIIFYRKDEKNFDDFMFVNRETGDYMQRYRSWLFDHVNLTQGACEKSEFTGFPKRKF